MDMVTITRGFSEEERTRVGSLYWEAFGRKLRPGFVDEATGMAVIRDALRPDHMLVARRGDEVAGVCGFYVLGTGAVDLAWSQLRRTLSIPAALRVSVVLSLLSRTNPQETLVLDGICVDRSERGRGIGTALLSAVDEHARRSGARTVRLSVVNSNPRARALYERRGFAPVTSGTLGVLAPVYGFDGYTTMERAVDR